MKEDKRVESELKKYGIKQYKIIRIICKSLSYLYKDGKVKLQETYEDKLDVKFRHKEKEGSFCISSYQSDYALMLIVRDSIMNSYCSDTSWNEVETIANITEDTEKKIFESYEKEEYVKWLDKELEIIEKQIDRNVALYYKVELSKYSILSNRGYSDEFLSKSQCTCIIKKNRVELANYGLFSDIAGRVLEQLHNDVPLYKKIERNNIFLLKGKAVAQFINKYILMYYGSYIYEGESFVKQGDLGVKSVGKDVELSVIPYEHIFFDGEGNSVHKKKIIEGGKIINCLCNSLYSQFMKIESYGNAALHNSSLIMHQRVIFKINIQYECNEQKVIVVKEFNQINIDIKKHEITGIIVIEENGREYNSFINFTADSFLENVKGSNGSYEWYDNVFCSELYYEQ